MNDPLAKIIDAVREHAKKLNLLVFYGAIRTSKKGTVSWDREHGGDWKSFLECSKSADTKIIYLHWWSFEGSDIEEALAALDDDKDESQPETEEEKSIRAQIEEFRNKVGLVATVEIAFVTDGFSHIYYESADWVPTFEDLTADEAETDQTGQFEDREQKADPAVVKKWARELASHPKYGSCRSDDQREFILEQLAGEDMVTLPLWPILRRAETIYLMEIKEKEEEALAAKARSLRDQGLNMNAIAKELHISRDRVSGLLAEGSKTKASS